MLTPTNFTTSSNSLDHPGNQRHPASRSADCDFCYNDPIRDTKSRISHRITRVYGEILISDGLVAAKLVFWSLDIAHGDPVDRVQKTNAKRPAQR